MIKRTSIACLIALWLIPSGLNAEQRALLVGVGKYTRPNIDLPGIDLDLDRMHDALKLMGFQDNQIHTLLDEQATSTNLIAEFEGWLRQGVKANDRVVFYFSGHGSQVPDLNGDEDDGVDEVLVTHDMRVTRINGQPSLTGVVIDDKLGELISKIPSRNVLIVVDSCHSGTITRSFSMKNRSLGAEPVFVKAFTYDGMPERRRRSGMTRGLTRGPAPATNYVSLTAAGDGEESIGTSRGGIFTIGLTEAMTRLAAQGRNITVNELRDESTQYIRTKVDKEQLYNPQVTGNPDLANGDLKIVAVTPANGVNRKKLLDLVAAQSLHFEISAPATKFAIDEPVKLTMKLPTAGYLNLVSVDAKDNATVLFPNRFQDSNAVSAGAFAIPTPQMAFDMLASEPTGPTLVVAFLSAEPINFYKETLDERDEKGNINADFSSLSHSATRAIRIAPRRSETYSAQLELQITAAAPRRP